MTSHVFRSELDSGGQQVAAIETTLSAADYADALAAWGDQVRQRRERRGEPAGELTPADVLAVIHADFNGIIRQRVRAWRAEQAALAAQEA